MLYFGYRVRHYSDDHTLKMEVFCREREQALECLSILDIGKRERACLVEDREGVSEVLGFRFGAKK